MSSARSDVLGDSAALAHLASLSSDVCFQCNRRTAGCRLALEMDLSPAQVVRHLRLGEWQQVLKSQANWIWGISQLAPAKA